MHLPFFGLFFQNEKICYYQRTLIAPPPPPSLIRFIMFKDLLCKSNIITKTDNKPSMVHVREVN